eukprot:scaffold140950_cov39-Prasinocladus_malaysianus.AAC.1
MNAILWLAPYAPSIALDWLKCGNIPIGKHFTKQYCFPSCNLSGSLLLVADEARQGMHSVSYAGQGLSPDYKVIQHFAIS